MSSAINLSEQIKPNLNKKNFEKHVNDKEQDQKTKMLQICNKTKENGLLTSIMSAILIWREKIYHVFAVYVTENGVLRHAKLRMWLWFNGKAKNWWTVI